LLTIENLEFLLTEDKDASGTLLRISKNQNITRVIACKSKVKKLKNDTMKPIKTIQNSLAALSLILLSSIAMVSYAQSNLDDITGQWKSIDDVTGRPKSIIEITKENGIYSGKVIHLINPSVPNPICKKCKGDLANKLIKGMVIIKNISKQKDSWSGGTILDPEKGKTYKVKFTLKKNRSKLKVRGYIGIPTIGRTQIWQRVRS